MNIQKNTRCARLFAGDLRYRMLPVFWRRGIFAAGSLWVNTMTVAEVCDCFFVDADALVDELNHTLRQPS